MKKKVIKLEINDCEGMTEKEIEEKLVDLNNKIVKFYNIQDEFDLDVAMGLVAMLTESFHMTDYLNTLYNKNKEEGENGGKN